MTVRSADNINTEQSVGYERRFAPVILRNESSEAMILPRHGGALHRFMFTRSDGSQVNVVAGHENLNGYQNDGWEVGRVVAPAIGRIRRSVYQIDGHDELAFPPNPYTNGHALHSGGQGSETRLPDLPNIVTIDPNGKHVIFHWNNVESHGERIKYGLTLKYELLEDGYAVEMITSVDPNSEPFYLNPADHTYRKNGGVGSDGRNQTLVIDLNEILETDANLIPTGQRLAVEGALDFRNGARIGDVALDNFFFLKNTTWAGLRTVKEYETMIAVGISLAHVATLTDPTTGITLDVRATVAGVQVFNGWENGAVALEPMIAPPDSINLEEFREGVIAKPGEKYIMRMEYHYSETS